MNNAMQQLRNIINLLGKTVVWFMYVKPVTVSTGVISHTEYCSYR